MNKIRIFFPGDPGYFKLQAALAQHYERRFGARPSPAPDEFWCLVGTGRDAPGHGCLGLSWGGSGKLFSEHYLNRSAADLLGAPTASVVEIGQFASFSGKGSGAYLMACVLRFLAMAQDTCAIVTGTAQVRRLFDRLNVSFTDLGIAHPDRVPDREVEWGTYYEHDPRVLSIDLRRGANFIRQPAWTDRDTAEPRHPSPLVHAA